MSESASTIEAVALKLPTFWTSCPEAWFAQAEAQFSIRSITADNTKYSYVVSALDTTTATRALSILTSPPLDNKYDTIKKFLLSAFGLSDSERARNLFKISGLGDSKPSELMDSMLALLGSHEPCFLFRHLFMTQLPDFIRTPLATSTETDCRKLALEADKYFVSGKEVTPSASVDAVQKPVSSARSNKPVSARPVQTSDVCWYHQRFGNRAKRCLSPCQFQPHAASTSQGNGPQGRQ